MAKGKTIKLISNPKDIKKLRRSDEILIRTYADGVSSSIPAIFHSLHEKGPDFYAVARQGGASHLPAGMKTFVWNGSEYYPTINGHRGKTTSIRYVDKLSKLEGSLGLRR